MPLEYLDPNSRQTLRAALLELRAAEGLDDNDASTQVAPDLSADLDLHDAIHIIFGCPTDVRGEVLAHVWTLLGTTAMVRDLHRVVSHQDHRAALAKIGHGHLVRMWITSVPVIASTIWRALQMKSRLPVADLPALLDQRLDQIRSRYGIRFVVRGGDQGPGSGAIVRRLHRERASSAA